MEGFDRMTMHPYLSGPLAVAPAGDLVAMTTMQPTAHLLDAPDHHSNYDNEYAG